MKDFKKYIKDVKGMLTCNCAEKYENYTEDLDIDELSGHKKCYITYLYTNNQIETNLNYFRQCMEDGLSPYKSLLFFDDYLKGDYL